MEFTFPWLGRLGASTPRLLRIMDVMDAKSLQIYEEKKKDMENRQAYDDRPKDVLATLSESWRPAHFPN